MRKVLTILLLTSSVAACRWSEHVEHGLAGSRHASFQGSELVTDFRNDRKSTKIALAHVLFIPDRDVPVGGFGNFSSCGGSVARQEMGFHYYEDTGFSVQAEPVAILDATTVKSSKQVFHLSEGNLFVALVHDDGTVDLSQVHRVVQDANVPAEAILDVIKVASPRNARVQALIAPKA